MIQDILIPLIIVGLAELGDKTQLSTLLLASKTEKHLHLLFGVILAFLLSILAIYLGNFISNRVNRETIAKIAGISFIVIGLAFFLI